MQVIPFPPRPLAAKLLIADLLSEALIGENKKIGIFSLPHRVRLFLSTFSRRIPIMRLARTASHHGSHLERFGPEQQSLAGNQDHIVILLSTTFKSTSSSSFFEVYGYYPALLALAKSAISLFLSMPSG
jgi:hypothetical protein